MKLNPAQIIRAKKELFILLALVGVLVTARLCDWYVVYYVTVVVIWTRFVYVEIEHYKRRKASEANR